MNGWEAMEEKSTPRPGSRQQPGRPTNLGPREEHQFPFPDLPLPRLPAEPDPGITSSSTTMDIAITAGPDPGITSSSTTMDIAIIAGSSQMATPSPGRPQPAPSSFLDTPEAWLLNSPPLSALPCL
ncbi:glycophorin-C isoform X4 [Pongo abelii]|uniref:glycophorin-C isoform X4 n=1 Tax=Pongo abelii TaxID=9601 RepID=UPI0030077547